MTAQPATTPVVSGLRLAHALLLIAAAGFIFVAMGHGGGFLVQAVIAGPLWASATGGALSVGLLAAAVRGPRSLGVTAIVFVLGVLYLPVVAVIAEGVNTFTLLTMIPFALLALLVIPHVWFGHRRGAS